MQHALQGRSPCALLLLWGCFARDIIVNATIGTGDAAYVHDITVEDIIMETDECIERAVKVAKDEFRSILLLAHVLHDQIKQVIGSCGGCVIFVGAGPSINYVSEHMNMRHHLYSVQPDPALIFNLSEGRVFGMGQDHMFMLGF